METVIEYLKIHSMGIMLLKYYIFCNDICIVYLVHLESLFAKKLHEFCIYLPENITKKKDPMTCKEQAEKQQQQKSIQKGTEIAQIATLYENAK